MDNRTLRKLPIGVQTFEKMRKDGYVYVDKTKYIYELVNASSQYFLSRPRRFGKSLFLSTLRAYWEGKRELFEGLDIVALEEDNKEAWQVYPVFYFDFNKDNFQREMALEDVLNNHLKKWEKEYGCAAGEASLAARFQNLLVKASEQTGKHCVVLVDEYDKSLLETIQNPTLAEHNKAVFKGFFSTLKSYDEYLQFVFITGVTKFSKVSIFSDLNQLKDISLKFEYAGICGITEEELKETFQPEIQAMAEEQGLSVEGCLAKLRQTYDGYHFHPKGEGVYNPFSLLNALDDREYNSYWFATGTPTFLVQRLHDIHFDIRRIANKTLYADEAILSDYRADNPDPVPLLYQTGYLTIAD
ncbi:MAG: AAA family ATPase, partial [Selenomonadaceae bacterium]|nr:AAA family ATPase [Selenomonadaceae bacterium]